MKQKLFAITFVAVLAITAGWNFNQSKNEVVLSDLALANVDALARGENPNDPNLGRGMKRVECYKEGKFTGTKCDTGRWDDECHYVYDQMGKCD